MLPRNDSITAALSMTVFRPQPFSSRILPLTGSQPRSIFLRKSGLRKKTLTSDVYSAKPLGIISQDWR